MANDWAAYVVGRYYRSFGLIYFADSVDENGFWMTQVDKPEERRNVSGRAIDRTYHDVDRHFWEKPGGQKEAALMFAQTTGKPQRYKQVTHLDGVCGYGIWEITPDGAATLLRLE